MIIRNYADIIYHRSGLGTGDIVWACAFKRGVGENSFRFYSEPIKGMLTYSNKEYKEQEYNWEERLKEPRYFVPFKKKAKSCFLSDLAWSKAVEISSRCYTTSKEECIELYNSLINEDINALQLLIAENEALKIS